MDGRKDLALPQLLINGEPVTRVSQCKLLGVTLTNTLSWDENIDQICSKASQRIYLLCLLRRSGVSPQDILHVYTSMIRPVLEYACEVWHTQLTVEQSDALEHIQKRAMSIAYPDKHYTEALTDSRLESLYVRRDRICRSFFKKMQASNHKLNHHLPQERTLETSLRSKIKYPLPRIRTERCKKSLINYSIFNYQ